MEPVRRRRYGSCRDCGWIYELAAQPGACATCGASLGAKPETRPYRRAAWTDDGQPHVAAHVKATSASTRAPWAERLSAELEARRSRPRPDASLRSPTLRQLDARVVPGGHDTTMDALMELGGLRLSPGQVATRAALAAGLMVALVAWIVL